ncbi:MAG: ribosomal protein L21e-domain-containing protein [Benniella sp.]|nr:MAG: ribosomal protein L21e-domain-containing protein [Benniella sp.]
MTDHKSNLPTSCLLGFDTTCLTRMVSAREHGMPTCIKLTTYMKTCMAGDIVDTKANASIHKGMPHKFYHDCIGIVYNVTKSTIGIIVNKKVENRFIEKRVNIRMEHIKHSKCRDDFLRRVKENTDAKLKARDMSITRDSTLTDDLLPSDSQPDRGNSVLVLLYDLCADDNCHSTYVMLELRKSKGWHWTNQIRLGGKDEASDVCGNGAPHGLLIRPREGTPPDTLLRNHYTPNKKWSPGPASNAATERIQERTLELLRTSKDRSTEPRSYQQPKDE